MYLRTKVICSLCTTSRSTFVCIFSTSGSTRDGSTRRTKRLTRVTTEHARDWRTYMYNATLKILIQVSMVDRPIKPPINTRTKVVLTLGLFVCEQVLYFLILGSLPASGRGISRPVNCVSALRPYLCPNFDRAGGFRSRVFHRSRCFECVFTTQFVVALQAQATRRASLLHAARRRACGEPWDDSIWRTSTARRVMTRRHRSWLGVWVSNHSSIEQAVNLTRTSPNWPTTERKRRRHKLDNFTYLYCRPDIKRYTCTNTCTRTVCCVDLITKRLSSNPSGQNMWSKCEQYVRVHGRVHAQ